MAHQCRIIIDANGVRRTSTAKETAQAGANRGAHARLLRHHTGEAVIIYQDRPYCTGCCQYPVKNLMNAVIEAIGACLIWYFGSKVTVKNRP